MPQLIAGNEPVDSTSVLVHGPDYTKAPKEKPSRMMDGVSVESVSRGMVLFFFSSRRRHTRSDRDWSSDVCSSDLWRSATPVEQIGQRVLERQVFEPRVADRQGSLGGEGADQLLVPRVERDDRAVLARSEERRVGKECRSRWSPYH